MQKIINYCISHNMPMREREHLTYGLWETKPHLLKYPAIGVDDVNEICVTWVKPYVRAVSLEARLCWVQSCNITKYIKSIRTCTYKP